MQLFSGMQFIRNFQAPKIALAPNLPLLGVPSSAIYKKHEN